MNTGGASVPKLQNVILKTCARAPENLPLCRTAKLVRGAKALSLT